jgi:transcriptional regulator
MYLPKHFAETDLTMLDWLAAHDSFGTLVSQVDGAPFATHMPVRYERTDNRVTLDGHWARPNPQWSQIAGQRAMFIFHGPHAYISPRWYVEPKRHVPTWNYATAHVYGRVEVYEDPERIEKHVAGLADRMEAGAEEPWSLAGAPANRKAVGGIVGFELVADDIQIKLKLNQNHPEGNIRGVIAALSADAAPDSQAIAQLMRDALEKKQR